MGLCEPVVNLNLLLELFSQRHKQTVYRWNMTTPGPGKRLPPPDAVLGDMKVWNVSTILSWASAHNERVNPAVLDRILVEQS